MNKLSDKIINSFYHYNQIEYQVGHILEVNNYDNNINNVCSTGIHFFKSIMRAYLYELKTIDIKDQKIDYFENGQIKIKYHLIDGLIHGSYIEYHMKDKLESLATELKKTEYLETKREKEKERLYNEIMNSSVYHMDNGMLFVY